MRKVLFLLVMTGGFVVGGRVANAEPSHRFHGSICQPTNGSRDRVDYGPLGVTNTNTSSTAIIECPLTMPQRNGFILSISIVVTDRHSSQNVSCTVQPTSLLGDAIDTTTRTSTGSAASQQNFDFPYGGNEHVFAWNWRARCTLPAKSGSNSSWVHFIDVETD